MTALVHELVNMASTLGVSTSDLLRKTLVAARRLGTPEIVTWINSELNGYGNEEVPEYRRLRGQLKVRNPYHGWIPFHVPPDMSELLTEFSASQSIPELQRLLVSGKDLMCPFPAEMEQTLMGMMQRSSGVALQPTLLISPVQVEGVVEIVRSRILDWALDLEGRGILGEGMTFTVEERQAVQAQHYHFDNINGSQIQIASNGSTQNHNQLANDLEALKGLISAFSNVVDNNPIPSELARELRAELATLTAQSESPKPKWEVIRMTAHALKSIAEGAAGNILGELAKPHILTLLTLAASSVG